MSSPPAALLARRVARQKEVPRHGLANRRPDGRRRLVCLLYRLRRQPKLRLRLTLRQSRRLRDTGKIPSVVAVAVLRLRPLHTGPLRVHVSRLLGLRLGPPLRLALQRPSRVELGKAV